MKKLSSKIIDHKINNVLIFFFIECLFSKSLKPSNDLYLTYGKVDLT
jgi:hypothetical protein